MTTLPILITTLPIDAIKIGARHRKDMGDIARLARSIEKVGLLQPIGVTRDNELVFGERRVLACKHLGWTEVVARVVDIESIVAGEYHENEIRKDFAPTERVAIGAALERQAGNRQGQRTDMQLVEKVPQVEPGRKTREVAAERAGFGNDRTYRQAKEIVVAAEEDPETFGPIASEMDRTGNVGGAYRKLRQKKDESERLATTPVAGKFRTIVMDPPWDHEGLSLAGRGRPEYAVMSHDELLALPVPVWADDECHLYLWSTNNFLPRAIALIEHWGFAYKTCLTWVKPRIGLGSYFRSSTEQVLFAVKGAVNTRTSDIPTHFEAPVGEHSAKPDVFYEIVERASYPTVGEAFQRTARPEFVNLFEKREAA